MTTPQLMAAIRRWVGNSRQWVSTFLDAAAGDPNVVAVIAIGSAVRERGHRRSDLDLLILYRGRPPQFKPPLEIDVRMYKWEKARDQIAAGHEVLCWALMFGVPLHDPEGKWSALESEWRGRIPLPSSDEALARAEASLEKSREMLEIGDDSAADDLILSALTQFVRERLISHGVFPASRPELPGQLRAIGGHDPLADLLEDSMYSNVDPRELLMRVETIRSQVGQAP